MSEVDSGYEVTEIRSLGSDNFKLTLYNDVSGDGFTVTISNYSAIEDEDFDDMLRDEVDSRLDELEQVNIDEAERIAEGATQQGRKGWKAKKTEA